MIALGAILLVYGLFNENKVKLTAACIIVGVGIFSFLPDVFFDRWSDAVESGGSGRISIWIVGLQSLKQFFLQGAGLGNFPFAYNKFITSEAANVAGYSRAAHNTYLSVLVELGFIGFLIMLVMIWMHFKAIGREIMKYDKDQIMLMAVLLASLISTFFAEFTLDKSYWLVWMMILMYKNVRKRDNCYNTDDLKNR